jgi:hypothetical protein
MSYRDDRDADQARIDALEGELSSARKRIAELEHRDDQALVLARGGALAPRTAAVRWLGAPLTIELTRTFDHAYPVDRLEDLLPTIRRVAERPGMAEVLRSSLTWRAAFPGTPTESTVVSVVVRDGKTELVVSDRLRQLAGALYGGFGAGVGSVGIGMAVAASVAVPVLTPIFVVAGLCGVYGGVRALFVRLAKKRARIAQRLFDRLCEEIDATR